MLLEGHNMTQLKERIITGTHYATGEVIKLSIQNGYIKSIKERATPSQENMIISPGLIDIQINGYMGIDFNDSPLSQTEWEEVIYNLAKVGTMTFYPTIITNSREKLAEIFEGNAAVINNNRYVKQFIKGFHLEGPYISENDGPRGAHSKEYVREPCWEEFCYLQEKAEGMIKLLTLSPEWSNAEDFIRKVSHSGVKVSIGHTAATAEQIKSAIEAGAVLSTHLGNGAHATLPRHPNYIWDQLAEKGLWASVISDGHHLPVNVLKVIQEIKKSRMILVSDSVALAGMEPGNYWTPVGGDVCLTKQGRLHLRNHHELLAGSAMNLLQGVNHLTAMKLSNATEAINRASIYPATLMEIPQSEGLCIGNIADLILLKENKRGWEVSKSFKNGELIATQS